MNLTQKNNIAFPFWILLLCVITFSVPQIKALPLTTYCNNSVLSEGKWVKISVPKSGIYKITESDLKKWGFNDPSKVNIYGYGAKTISDVLSKTNYIDDLPVVQSVNTNNGIVFYAQGPEQWVSASSASGQYVQKLNPFTSVAYYFISDRDSVANPEIKKIGNPIDASVIPDAIKTFVDFTYHEKNLVNYGETGQLMLGEDFKWTPSQSFNFTLSDKVADTEVWMECQFAAKTFNTSSSLTFTINGQQLESSSNDRIASCTSSAYIHGKSAKAQHKFNITGESLKIGITHSSTATVQMAHLDYLCINYTRHIKLKDGLLKFRANKPTTTLEGASTNTHVWDITDPLNIKELNITLSGNNAVWKNPYTGIRQYMAWDENSNLPSPTFVENVANQNLHNLETPDMVIFTISDWSSQAERIASLHRNSADSLNVIVVDQNQVFNEFASGSPDVNSFRKMLKMFWDRGNENNTPLKYALFFGRGIFDNQHLTEEAKRLNYPTMPYWQSEKGLDDNESFGTDDIFAFLKDDAGSNMGADSYCIAIGRMPVRSSNEAKTVVDKLYQYVNEAPKGEWKNQIMLLADDMDNGVHMTQSESMWQIMTNGATGSEFLYNKLYIDAFTREGASYPQARAQMFRLLEEGTVWWNYIGHANTTSWTHDGILSYSDMTNLYLKKYPMLYAATCDFMRWDGFNTSGAEVLYTLPDGGVIAAISASRPVYIANNGVLSNAIAPYIIAKDENGKYLTIGEILRKAKNNMPQDRNKLRFALMGDPAMRLATPSNKIVISDINGSYIDQGEEAIIQARQKVTIAGKILNSNGVELTDFNGVIHSTLYDAEHSTTSHGYSKDDDGLEVTFEEHGSKLYAGRDSVINGEFKITLSMPTEIANNFRPATLNLYAQADNSDEAIGCNRNFYVYGFDESADIDTIPPTIEYFYLNHEDFASGDMVNESPMVIARISDNVGINLSSAGVGHQMSLRLDANKSYSDVSLYYTPEIGETVSGIIKYPIENLSDGNHSLRLKVWDTAGNSTEKEISLNVEQGIAPRIFDVYTDASPAVDEVNFYIRHDRPDAMATVEVQVFDLMGQLVWSSSRTGQSDMSISTPINWNLCNLAGHRVNRGIYVYKALISTDGQQFSSKANKLAVAPQ